MPEVRKIAPIIPYDKDKLQFKHKLNPAPYHLGGDFICAIDLETTGVDLAVDSIWELAVVPLDTDYLPSKQFPPYYVFIKPKMPIENIDFDIDVNCANRKRILEAYSSGLEIDVAMDVFSDWHRKLDIVPGKKIQCIGFNVGFDISFMQMAFGVDWYKQYFSHKCRDVMQIEMYLDDCAFMRGEKLNTPFYRLSDVVARYNVTNVAAHNALADAIVTAEIYSAQTRVLQ